MQNTPTVVTADMFERVGDPIHIRAGRYTRKQVASMLYKAGVMNLASPCFSDSNPHGFETDIDEDMKASVVRVVSANRTYDDQFFEIASRSGLSILPQAAGPIARLHSISLDWPTLSVATKPLGRRFMSSPRHENSKEYLWKLGRMVATKTPTIAIVDAGARLIGAQFWLFRVYG
ncbi:MAG TPA: hypothetical protein VFT82_04650 [Candidatus Paceibacterota bacterium]|nr:hypothetical protein [Candidatus Paceibacterota bacterium]